MNHDTATVSLAEVAGADPLRPIQAVTIVQEVIARIGAGIIAGVPSPQIIRLSATGRMSVEGPIAADARTVGHAAHLLSTLLPGFDRHSKERVPGALRLVIARASRALDVPPYPSLAALAADLVRFGSHDPEACIRELVAEYLKARSAEQTKSIELELVHDAGAAPTLTISDIRRARRATGLTLADISARSGIPSSLLCELEWGYLDHWPAPEVARRLMARYAQAAGLDEQLVTSVASPLLEQRIIARDEQPQDVAVIEAEVLAESEPTAIVPAAEVVSLLSRSQAAAKRRSRARNLAVAALAIPALLVIGTLPAAREYALRHLGLPTGAIINAPDAQSASPGVPAAQAAEPASPVSRRPTPTPEAVRPAPVDSKFGSVEPVSVSDIAASSPAFASVGSAIFYHEKSGDQSSVMRAETDPEGSILRITSIVDDRSRNFHARPSPDGQRVAFDSDRDGERGVYIADADGRNVRRITGDGFAAIPSWSPDGSTLVYVRAERDRPKVWNLWMTNLTTGAERRLTSYQYGQPWGGSWFPDGKRIAYSHEDRLIVLSLTAGTSRIYPSPRKGSLVRTPAVSPDGRRAVFQVYRAGTWLLDFRSGAMKRVLADPSAEDYAWAPDGRRVAYHSRSAGKWGVWIMDDSNP